MQIRRALFIASFFIFMSSIAHADPFLLYANGTATGLENHGMQSVTGTFTGKVYVDLFTDNVTSVDIAFNFSSGITYDFQASAIPAISAVPGFAPYSNYSVVQNGTTTVQVVENPLALSTYALDFSFSDGGGYIAFSPRTMSGSILGVMSLQGPYQLSGTLSPVPEPSSLVLLGTGIAGLAGVIRRRLSPKRA